MTEALLHTIWKYKLLGQSNFIGTRHEAIEVVSVGEHNRDSGPDFFNSKIRINGLLLAGNVEIHIKTSDWLRHKHQDDKAYNNLVLHVVYEHDVELEQNNSHNVSVLELKHIIRPALLEEYARITHSQQNIPCGKSITSVSNIVWASWLDRLVVSRIEHKTEYIEHLFAHSKQNYEDTLYLLLCRNFGFKINNEAFELLGKSLPYSILKKYADNLLQLEALLYGCAGFLDELFEDDYPKLLQNEFAFLRHKHQLLPLKKENWKFSKTRPVNFPTIRISQLAHLMYKQTSLFHLLESKPGIESLRDFFDVQAHDYWHTHYRFDSPADDNPKPLGTVAFHTIVINTVVPFLFFMSRHAAKHELTEYALDLLASLPPEKNTKTNEFAKLGIKTQNALESQAQIHLYDLFCSKKACIHCSVAEHLLKNS
jgi:hypothetical protein